MTVLDVPQGKLATGIKSLGGPFHLPYGEIQELLAGTSAANCYWIVLYNTVNTHGCKT